MTAFATLDYLGTRFAQRGRGNAAVVVAHQVYVCWLPAGRDLLAGMLHLAAHEAARCPECQAEWPLLRAGGVVRALAEHGAGRVSSVSDACPHCPTIVHWDTTPPERRPRLRWTGLYDRHPELMGERSSRVGVPILTQGGAR